MKQLLDLKNNMIVRYEYKKLEKNMSCHFCPLERCKKGGAEWKILTFNVESGKNISNDFACEDCKLKIDSRELECAECKRLVYRDGTGTFCGCDYPLDKQAIFTPRQTEFGDRWENKEARKLQKEKNRVEREKQKAEEELGIEREQFIKFQEKSEEWSKKQKQELIEKNEELATKSRRLSNENKTLKKQVEELETQLLGVDETNKKAHRLSDENRNLKSKVEGLEQEIEKYKGEALDIKPTVSQLKSDVLELEAKLEKMIVSVELQAQQEQPPK